MYIFACGPIILVTGHTLHCSLTCSGLKFYVESENNIDFEVTIDYKKLLPYSNEKYIQLQMKMLTDSVKNFFPFHCIRKIISYSESAVPI